jgi:hypothetical protein
MHVAVARVLVASQGVYARDAGAWDAVLEVKLLYVRMSCQLQGMLKAVRPAYI